MATSFVRSPCSFLFFSLLISSYPLSTLGRSLLSPAERSTYIIHVHRPPAGHDRESWHASFLPELTSTSPVGDKRMLYSYTNVISGFAARLTLAELSALKSKPGFVRATPDFVLPLATTHTPQFLGLTTESGFWNESGFGRGVIVALLDTGVLPNHPSFRDQGMPPPPSKWKGRCEFNTSNTCNNKLIGARAFLKGLQAMRKGDIERYGTAENSPLDTTGHGTHTASTAVGRFVSNTSALGNAGGTAVGMAPEAHLAVYKICTEFGCAASDILAGLDAAVEEEADVLSLSLGGQSMPFDSDPIAIGTFAAVEKGIFVSLAAGNEGPLPGTISNEAPWMLTVGASTMDRVIETTVKLGNGEKYNGESLFQTSSIAEVSLPLVYPGALGTYSERFCYNNTIQMDVKGKIVICDRSQGMGRIEQGAVIKGAGGAGMILAAAPDDGYTIVADAHVLPASHVNYADATKIKAYLNSTSSPTATIIPRGTLIGQGLPAPMVAAFSSRGPSLQSRGVLKPDIIGPGVDVLAGWPALPIGPSDAPSLFNVISGTSMATPHLSGIAALLRSAHPTWSPAAIRSAIMTTASNANTAGKAIADQTLKDADLFAKGAGHVDPSRAGNPGMVYDMQPNDYIAYLCGMNYSDKQMAAVARRNISCSEITPIFDAELNYPSFLVEMKPSFATKVSRTVTNVGYASCTYEAEIGQPPGISVTVSPAALRFTEVGQKLSYAVEFRRDGRNSTVKYVEGYLSWVSSDKLITVRSPIAIAFTDK